MARAAEYADILAAIVWHAEQSPWRLTSVNPRVASLGHAPALWVEDPAFFPAHLHVDDRERFLAVATKISDGEIRLQPLRVLAQDGRPVSMSVILQGVAAGRVMGVMFEADPRDALAIDQLAVILDAVPGSITMQDRTQQMVFANKTAYLGAGYATAQDFMNASHGEILGKYKLWDQAGEPVTYDRLPGPTALLGRESELMIRFQVVGEPGDDRWVLVRARPIFDGAGQVRLSVNVYDDQTDRIRAAENARFLSAAGNALAASLDVHETARTLARLPVPCMVSTCRVYLAGDGGEMTLAAETSAGDGAEDHVFRVPLQARGKVIGEMALTRTRERGPFAPHLVAVCEELGARGGLYLDNAANFAEAQAAVRARDDFLAVASHDLKSPLGAILFSASVLLRCQGDGPEWDRVRRSAESILHASEAMERLVHDLVDLAALDAGRLAAVKLPIAVDELVSHGVKMYEPLATERSVSLRTTLPPGSLSVSGDRDRLSQVLGNVLANAIEHSPPQESVCVTVERRPPYALFSVADRGPGIDPKVLPTVFDRYTRGASSSGRHSTGLGLSIAEGLVRAHGGRIWVESDPGQGARFYFTVPLA